MVLTLMDRTPVATDVFSDAVALGTCEPVDQHIVKVNLNVVVGNVEAEAAFLGKRRVQNAPVHLYHPGRSGLILLYGPLHSCKHGVMVGLLKLKDGYPFAGYHIEKKDAEHNASAACS